MIPIAFLYTTVPDKATAIHLASQLLEKGLIACANLFDNGVAIYRWEGKIREETETFLLLKTSQELVEQVTREVKQLHPYQIPCLVEINLKRDLNSDFTSWLLSQVK